jgi:hypothetical protein
MRSAAVERGNIKKCSQLQLIKMTSREKNFNSSILPALAKATKLLKTFGRVTLWVVTLRHRASRFRFFSHQMISLWFFLVIFLFPLCQSILTTTNFSSSRSSKWIYQLDLSRQEKTHLVECEMKAQITFIMPSSGSRSTIESSVNSILQQTLCQWKLIIVYSTFQNPNHDLRVEKNWKEEEEGEEEEEDEEDKKDKEGKKEKRVNPHPHGLEIYPPIQLSRYSQSFESDPRIFYLPFPRQSLFNYGGSSRNIAMKYITTDWVAYLDDDDEISEDYLTIFQNETLSHPKISVILFRMSCQTCFVQVIPPVPYPALIPNYVGLFCFHLTPSLSLSHSLSLSLSLPLSLSVSISVSVSLLMTSVLSLSLFLQELAMRFADPFSPLLEPINFIMVQEKIFISSMISIRAHMIFLSLVALVIM